MEKVTVLAVGTAVTTGFLTLKIFQFQIILINNSNSLMKRILNTMAKNILSMKYHKFKDNTKEKSVLLSVKRLRLIQL